MKANQKIQLHSILEKVAPHFSQTKQDLTISKTIFEKCITDSEIKDIDKKKMVVVIRNCKSYASLQQYFYNSLLKFEGHSVYGHDKPEQIEPYSETV